MQHSSFSRRGFLQVTAGAFAGAVAATATGCSSPASAAAPGMGVQLYCFRYQLREDFPGTLARVAGLGFEGVEFAGYYDYSAAQLRQMLADNGVSCCGSHIQLQTLQGDELQRTIDFNLELGNPYLIVAGLNNQQRATKDALLRSANDFNEVAEKIRPHGLRTGYHAHAYSFETMFDGESLWDVLAQNTTQDVILQMDTGNGSHGGAQVVQAIQRYPGRTVSMHVKPYTPSAEDPFDPYIGDDALDWPEIFRVSETVGGIEWYIIEYEQDTAAPFEPLRVNLERARAIRAA